MTSDLHTRGGGAERVLECPSYFNKFTITPQIVGLVKFINTRTKPNIMAFIGTGHGCIH